MDQLARCCAADRVTDHDASLPVRLASVYSQRIVNGREAVSARNGELTDGPTIPDRYPLCRALLRGCTSSSL